MRDDSDPFAEAGAGLHGFDETCRGDLANVVEGRNLSRAAASWLARAVTGAVRPNRDRPLWVLAHSLHALRRAFDPRETMDLLLDPALAGADALAARLDGAAGLPGDRLGLANEDFRTTWHGLSRSLALAEFVATADGLKHFRDMLDALAALDDGDVAAFVSRLSAWMRAYRTAHMPMAAVERRFVAILAFLAGRDGTGDRPVLDYWLTTLDQGLHYVTVVEHFVTFERTSVALADLGGVLGAASLEGIVGWEERLEAVCLPPPAERDLAQAVDMLAATDAEAPKILTERERAQVAALLRFDPFQRSRALTVLRAISFGAVQSGVANRLRRGGGGADLRTRLSCRDAEPYARVAERLEGLAGHLRRCVRIAYALRSGAGDDVAVEGRRELARMRRQGFDRPAPLLAPHFAAVDEALADVLAESDAFAAAARKVPAATFGTDQAIFAAAFARIYAAHVPEMQHGDA